MAKEKINNKNHGIGLLRVYAVFCVVVLHFLLHGGVLYSTVIDSSQYKYVWLLEIVAYPAVDLFALISGYVYYENEKVNKSLYSCFKIWISVVFYCLLITILFDIFSDLQIGVIDYIKSFFPISNRFYWYFTCYFGLSIIMPVVEKGLESLNENKAKNLFFLIIIVFSIFDRIPNVLGMEFGYCFAWLLLLFILGALIKKCDIGNKLNSISIFLLIVALFCIMYVYKIYGFEFKVFDYVVTRDLLVNYTSPTILGCAILLLILFSRFKFNNFFERIITYFSTSSFFVYIINDNPLIRLNIIKDYFAKYSTYPVMKIYAIILGASILFLVGAVLIDKVRTFIFDKTGINKLLNKNVQ